MEIKNLIKKKLKRGILKPYNSFGKPPCLDLAHGCTLQQGCCMLNFTHPGNPRTLYCQLPFTHISRNVDATIETN